MMKERRYWPLVAIGLCSLCLDMCEANNRLACREVKSDQKLVAFVLGTIFTTEVNLLAVVPNYGES